MNDLYVDYCTGSYFNSPIDNVTKACEKVNEAARQYKEGEITWNSKDEYLSIQKEVKEGVLDRLRYIEESRKTKMVEDFFKTLGIEPSLETLYQCKAKWFY